VVHIKIAWFLIGLITGIVALLLTLAFMMGARPDSEKKRQEDWEGLKEYERLKMERWFRKGYNRGFAEAVKQHEQAIKLYEELGGTKHAQ
jgi:hypothetical protein